MKTLLPLLLVTMMVACKKEQSYPLHQQQHSSATTWNAVINTKDTVKFTHWWDSTGTVQVFQSGKGIQSFDNVFYTPCDTCAYAKAFYFTLRRSARARIAKGIVKIGDEGQKAQAIGSTDKTITFTFTTPVHLTPQNSFEPLSHGLGVTIRPPAGVTSPRGEWYQLRLDSALILHVYPRPQARMITYNLPQWGPKMIFQ